MGCADPQAIFFFSRPFPSDQYKTDDVKLAQTAVRRRSPLWSKSGMSISEIMVRKTLSRLLLFRKQMLRIFAESDDSFGSYGVRV
jgi:hypothetical protein